MIPPAYAGRVTPAAVLELAAGRELTLVWQNDYAWTYELGPSGRPASDRSFVKWSPAANPLDLDAEAARMSWAAPYTPVPKVLAQGADETGSWLVTAALPGRNAIDSTWIARPEIAVRAIGEGLRALHDTLPVASCPFSWTAEDRLKACVEAARTGWEGPGEEWHEEYAHLTLAEALDQAAEIPPADKLVVCHGDACAPNTLLTDDGRWSGHVDLGCLGIADRWADLAVATWSTEWNYGPDWERLLLDAYGVPPDEDRTRYYRLLWDLG